MAKDVIRNKAFLFAAKVVEAVAPMIDKKEFIFSGQLKKSGTAIGALVWEADQAESRPDFVHKMAIALKEANETKYWLELLYFTKHISEQTYTDLKPELQEILKMLTAIIKTAKQNILNQKSA